jgi:hypothetical protein
MNKNDKNCNFGTINMHVKMFTCQHAKHLSMQKTCNMQKFSTCKNVNMHVDCRTMKGDCTPRGFEHVGKTAFCGKANRSKKEQGEPEEEEGIEDEAPNSDVNPSGRDHRQKG